MTLNKRCARQQQNKVEKFPSKIEEKSKQLKYQMN